MKKALLLVCVLTISVISTACINKFAVQELNNKAMAYMEKGDYEEAIHRLKSGIDLDDSIFETHYNLAVAYTKVEDYVKALDAYKKAISLNPDCADCYYSMAVAQESIITELQSGELVVNDEGEIVKNKSEDKDDDEGAEVKAHELSATEQERVLELAKEAVNNYNAYLDKSETVDNEEEIKDRISDLEKIVNGDEKD